MNKMKKSPLAAAIGTAVVSTFAATAVHAEANPFALNEMSEGYMQLAAADADAAVEAGKAGEMKCGASMKKEEGRCGDGKCGEGKCAGKKAAADGEKAKEGKCGEVKCGEGKKADGKSKEGKCGEGKCGEGKKADSKAKEGKCGEGKCGEGKCGEAKGKAGDTDASALDAVKDKAVDSAADAVKNKFRNVAE
jgi:uncharacterized low-complexity protein